MALKSFFIACAILGFLAVASALNLPTSRGHPFVDYGPIAAVRDDVAALKKTLLDPTLDFSESLKVMRRINTQKMSGARSTATAQLPPDAPQSLKLYAKQMAARARKDPTCCPQYSSIYGIIFKDKLAGRWKTWVNSSVWWWGADDWATGYRTCRLTKPDRYGGYPCDKDATCPGCPRCLGINCFMNENTQVYSASSARLFASTLMSAAQNPKNFGVCQDAGSPDDTGCQ